MSTGKIEEFNQAQGTGRIKDDDGPKRHFSRDDVPSPAERTNLRQGDKVEFQVDAEDGHAAKVRKAR
ncbi:hypothetical protein BIV25_28995 [Streptomyces sp. MUSC 14]|uniref:cold-shock protein n=1 Tax=Streptomyces sp. MUSC 14 TaxID=1354889 RepID=UPI0008F5D5C4|nr:cold shock domain-containing protein [Streptomyces sp. MUSC 14]OIJ91794.1 hypothetical protein BIV25_28995 [Streptomyces sp. MUSC 14]